MAYTFLEEEATADVAFVATAPDLPGLLRESARAVTATMVRDLAAVRPLVERPLAVRAPDPERLLHKVLEEVVYHKDAELLLMGDLEVRVLEGPQGLSAEGTWRGEPLDADRHAQVVDVKAVTWHRFEVARAPEGWRAFVILDI